MTDNQEKELFNILGTLVIEVSEIKTVQKEHTQILQRMESKSDTIAETVITIDNRLTKLESEVAELQSNIH